MKKTRAAVIAAILIIITLMSSCGSGSESTIIAAGSTSVQPYAEILAEEYALLYPGSDVDVQGGGSSAGITAAQSGTANIGMSSRGLKDAEKGLWSVEIAKDGLAVIIHPDNPVQNLTLDQIRAVYAAEITNWKDLGGNDAPVYVITREEGSGTRGAFEELVMNGTYITPKAIVQDSNGAVRLLVSDYINYIGFISLGLVQHEPGQKPVRALYLDGVEPTAENIRNGSYKLFRPFLFVADGQPEGLAKGFIDFALSEAGQKILSNEGLIPRMDISEEFDEFEEKELKGYR